MRAFGTKVTFAALAVVATGCAWGRFTDLKKDAPVVRLDPPDSYKGRFGLNLAVAQTSERSEIYVAGSPFDTGGLVYSLGVEDDPQPNPTDESHCQASDDCSTIERPLGINVSWTPSGERELCFISGYGEIGPREGLWTRCDDNLQFVYPVPDGVQDVLSAERDGDNPRALQLASNRSGDQLIAASTPLQGTDSGGQSLHAWVYLPGTGDAVELPTPQGAGDGFGSSLGVAFTEAGYLVAVGAPDSAEVWVYRMNGDQPRRLGCLSGDAKFGRTIASGDVDGDGDDDFIIADEDKVEILSGAELSDLPNAGNGDCEAQEILSTNDVERVELVCETSEDITGCNVSDFGSSLAVADVDGDGTGEIFVGAPDMAVREEAKAGAVLAYDGDGDLLKVQIVSNAKGDDLFGASVVGVAQGERDIVAVGAEGSRNVYLLYCAGGSDGNGSPRCQN